MLEGLETLQGKNRDDEEDEDCFSAFMTSNCRIWAESNSVEGPNMLSPQIVLNRQPPAPPQRPVFQPDLIQKSILLAAADIWWHERGQKCGLSSIVLLKENKDTKLLLNVRLISFKKKYLSFHLYSGGHTHTCTETCTHTQSKVGPFLMLCNFTATHCGFVLLFYFQTTEDFTLSSK